nr:hypothetical protein Itr_chr13CG01100 [Ipomoea trifida]
MKRKNPRFYRKIIGMVIMALGLEWRPSAEKGKIAAMPTFHCNHGVSQLGEVGIYLGKLSLDLFGELDIAKLGIGAVLREDERLEEWDGLFLPEKAIVLLFEVDERVAGFAVPYYMPGVPLARLDKLGWGIIVRDVEPEAMRNSSRRSLAKAERIATDKVDTFSVWIIESIEEMWSGGGQEVLDVLLKSIDFFARRIFGNLHHIIPT